MTSHVHSVSHSELGGPNLATREAGGDPTGDLDPYGTGLREKGNR